MSKLTRYADFGRMKEFDKFAGACSSAFADLVDIVNGNIDFQTNVNCVFVEFEIQADVELTVSHSLGRVPVGRIVTYQTCQEVIYDSDTTATIDTINLWCGSSGSVRMILF